MPIVARGHVRDRPFARTIYTVAAKEFSGDLVMTQGGRSYKVTWYRGAVVAADSPSPADSLGRIALTAGLVTSTQLGDAMRIAQLSPQKSQLQVLAEVARLSPQQVLTIKRRALAHRATRIFALADATFVLDSKPTLARDPELSPLSARWLIYQGLRTQYSEERLEDELAGALHAGFRLRPESRAALAEYGMSADAKNCVAQLNQQIMTLDQLQATFPRLTRKAVMALIYALLATDAISAEKPARIRPRAVPTGDQAAPRAEVGRAATGPLQQSDTERHAVPRQAQRTPSAAMPQAVTTKNGSANIKIPGHRARKKRGPDPKRIAQIRAVMVKKLQQLEADADHFELLGVARGAPVQAVRNAFYELAKRLHPDRLRAASVDADPATAHRLFASINQAFTVLSNPKKRAEYEAMLGQGGPAALEKRHADTQELARKIFEAEKQFQRGQIAARGNQWAVALDGFQKAVELNPDDAEHHALLAWAIWRNATDKEGVLGKVKQRFKKAIALSPRNVAAYLYRGRVAGELGDYPLALDCFRKVLEFEPDHNEAQLQIRLIKGRMGDSGKKKGLFDRIKRR